jgi:hypothetical protein
MSLGAKEVLKGMDPGNVCGFLDFSIRLLMPWAGIQVAREAIKNSKNVEILRWIASRRDAFVGTENEADWKDLLYTAIAHETQLFREMTCAQLQSILLISQDLAQTSQQQINVLKVVIDWVRHNSEKGDHHVVQGTMMPTLETDEIKVKQLINLAVRDRGRQRDEHNTVAAHMNSRMTRLLRNVRPELLTLSDLRTKLSRGDVSFASKFDGFHDMVEFVAENQPESAKNADALVARIIAATQKDASMRLYRQPVSPSSFLKGQSVLNSMNGEIGYPVRPTRTPTTQIQTSNVSQTDASNSPGLGRRRSC